MAGCTGTLVNSDLTSKLTRTSSSPIVVLRSISARCDKFSTCDGLICLMNKDKRLELDPIWFSVV